ncbi:hypothetical protein ACIBEF_03015 [Micromonospora sp. NPDC050795]|uniref:hypothetical protein n=1 Tax=Micromonospora sp. NPDC050795 TaxID=3364282 RepID=UPI0037A54113
MPVSPAYVIPGPESVNDLLKKIAERDQSAFGRLYRSLVRGVFIQVCRRVGSPSLAVAVTRAVFVEVWRLAPKATADQVDGLAWVTVIADRRAADRLRETGGHSSSPGTSYDEYIGLELTAVLGEEAPALLGAGPFTAG